MKIHEVSPLYLYEFFHSELKYSTKHKVKFQFLPFSIINFFHDIQTKIADPASEKRSKFKANNDSVIKKVS